MISATIPPIIRPTLFFFDGFPLSAASVSMKTLPAIQRKMGLPPLASRPAKITSSGFLVGQFVLA